MNKTQLEVLFLKQKFKKISDVFTIPKKEVTLLGGEVFLNHYPLSTLSNNKLFYIRSFGTDFNIFPYEAWRTNKSEAMFSIGPGIYGGDERTILLAQISVTSKTIEQKLTMVEELLSVVENVHQYTLVKKGVQNWITISINVD